MIRIRAAIRLGKERERLRDDAMMMREEILPVLQNHLQRIAAAAEAEMMIAIQRAGERRQAKTGRRASQREQQKHAPTGDLPRRVPATMPDRSHCV